LLTDLMMPEMDGFELAQRVRMNEKFRACSLIMVSSAARPGDAERCRSLGIARYLTKPVVHADLLESILRIVSTRGAENVSTAKPAAAPAESPAARNILLAEDGLINQRVAIGLLTKKGHNVVLAVNGREAVAAVERQPFDLILMDVQMPEMDGLEAARIIRMLERDSGKHTPIVAMTASAMKGDREICLEAGMDGYVSKPIDPAELYNAIEEFAPKGV
jgi:two-component system sensor histidine kinase/response regulator